MARELLKHFQTKQKSVEERMDAGKALRQKFPRSKQGDYTPSNKRSDPIAILEEQAKTRVPELVPIRYARMLTSPFAFLRGGAAIMSADLATQGNTTGLQVQACGDMHIANFGLFASAERNLIFGINDFDETLPGPWEWDLKRLVASIVAGGRFLGAGKGLCKDSVRAAVSSYRKRMKQYAFMGNMELWYTTIDEHDVWLNLKGTALTGLRKLAGKARERTHLQVLDKLTDIVDDKFRLRDDAPFIVHVERTETGRTMNEALELFLQSYTSSLADDRTYLLSQYRIVDVVQKVVGVGSVGTRCWVIFMVGNHDEDPLFLQLKEAQPSVLEPYLGASRYGNHGHRVVAGQRLIQGAPDIFLGWGEQGGIHYYVRQMRDMKGGIEFDPDKVKIENMPQYAALCAWALALAHAKSGDPAMIAGYVGKNDDLDEAMVNFAFAYADQTERDFKALTDAAKRGRIKVASESK
ncbi:MAG: DUF2252 domain-containing protein [Cyclobacteriaceae bacterium]|jgi:uncharacterized protein (DUF2252 family)|nr:DUF2252 domain-containing protein [Cyclobacteriaceae bacterium]